jgi:hypothetical protein
MNRIAMLTALMALALTPCAHAKDPSGPRPELKCSPADTPEEEAEKQISYFVDGREHIEYCVMGKKQVIIDSGDNG